MHLHHSNARVPLFFYDGSLILQVVLFPPCMNISIHTAMHTATTYSYEHNKITKEQLLITIKQQKKFLFAH